MGCITWRCFSSTSVLGVLAVLATTMPAYAAFLSLQATQSATSVAEASQAFAQKIYSDQIPMARPSVSILSGETSVSEELDNSYSSRTTKKYTASLILKNSGLRDTQRAWIALSSAGSEVSASPPSCSLLRCARQRQGELPNRDRDAFFQTSGNEPE